MRILNPANPNWRWLPALAATTIIAGSVSFLAKQSLAQADRCSLPYLQMTGVGHPGNVPSDPTQGELTIQRINIGEPFVSCADNTITIVMKVNNLDPAGTGQAVLPANSGWQVLFDVVGTDNATHTIYVILDTFPPFDNSGVPNFALGRRDPDPTTGGTVDEQQCFEQPPLFSCPQIAGSNFNKDGTITFKIHVSAGIDFTAPSQGSGVAFTWNGSAVGSQLTNIIGNTYLLAGVLLETVQTTGPSGPTYTRAGNRFCGPIPLAVLTSSPSPATGPVPLAVTFSGSSSSDPNPCAVLNSYTLNFGDGSPVVTQSSPSFAAHSYGTAGTFTASLTVGNDAGQVSTNPAQITVTATSALPPPLSSVVSRKTHAGTDFDIPLPLTGTRGVECRTGPNYKLVFTFVNNITSCGTASIGTVSPGPGLKQCTTDLTIVGGQQYISVTLNGAADALGNSGNVAGPQMGVLVGDTTADGSVNSADIGQTKSQSGHLVTISNFREDVTVDGSINSADIGLVKSKSGTALPSLP